MKIKRGRGRPKKQPTSVVSSRVPTSKKAWFKKEMKRLTDALK